MKVQFSSVSKTYDNKVKAVDDLNIKIKEGALHFILGPSGCGKTTTLRLLAGLEKPSCGKIFFDNQNVSTMSPKDRNIGMVFQNYALWPHMSVEENITYGLKIKKNTAKEISKKCDLALDLTQLSTLKKRYPSQLSGGQQQRVALARAIAIEPSILLLDEPLSNLDAKLRIEMRENILNIHQATKITTVYVTHDQKEALSMGTDITVMNKGKEVQTGSPRKLYQSPDSVFIADFIGDTNFIKGVVKDKTDFYKIQTDIGLVKVQAKNNLHFALEDKVILSIRPEAIRIDSSSQEIESNTFAAKILGNTYLGESEQISIITEKGQVKLSANIFAYNGKEETNDNKVCLSFLPESVHVLSAT